MNPSSASVRPSVDTAYAPATLAASQSLASARWWIGSVMATSDEHGDRAREVAVLLVEREELTVGREQRMGTLATEAKVQLAAVPDVVGVLAGQVDGGECRTSGVRDRDDPQLVEVAGREVQREGPDRRAAQRRQVATHTQGGTDVARDGPDVGPARAPDPQSEVE